MGNMIALNQLQIKLTKGLANKVEKQLAIVFHF